MAYLGEGKAATNLRSILLHDNNPKSDYLKVDRI